MPIYEYRCAKCGFQDEYLQKISEPPHTVCPKCGKRSFKKLLSAAGFQLKGSGWYATDFRGGGKPEAKAEGKGEPKSEGKGEPKAGETKSADTKSAETTSESTPASTSGTAAEPTKSSPSGATTN
ncbi:MAG: FmdB family zinc ribbon protein [Burkholderiales bacterium]